MHNIVEVGWSIWMSFSCKAFFFSFLNKTKQNQHDNDGNNNEKESIRNKLKTKDTWKEWHK